MAFEGMLITFGMAMGALLAFAGAMIAIQVNKKSYPYTFLNIEERQGGIVTEILKGKEFVNKDGTKNFILKPTILDNGFGAIKGKKILTAIPDKALTLVKKSGGVLAITFSPAENIYMPIAILKDKEKIEMIVRDTDARNWYKYTLESMLRHKLLNPKTTWQERAPALIIGAGFVVIILFIIYGTVLHPMLISQNAELAGSVANAISAFNNLGTSASSAIGGAANIPY